MSDAQLIQLPPAEADRAIRLTETIGWNHPLVLWERLLQWCGKGGMGLEIDGELVTTGLICCYGDQRAWIGGMITNPAYQRRGLGARMMDALMEHAQAQGIDTILLDASEEGYHMYGGLGFRPLYKVEVRSGTAPDVEPAAHIRPFTPADLPGIIALDAETFGIERSWIIEQLTQEFSDHVWVEGPPDDIRGFVCVQMMGGVGRIGPCAHRDTAGAKALLQTALAALDGKPVAMALLASNSQAIALADEYGIEVVASATRMIHGNTATLQERAAYSYTILSVATG
jgi:ribosomal protein S18 acetylase RimI-like enzyme